MNEYYKDSVGFYKRKEDFATLWRIIENRLNG